MKPITIDCLDLKAHVRWAQDQAIYDPTFVEEAILVAPHPEISATSSSYSSKVEDLFELQKKNQPWATFTPPSNFHLFSKRLFSYTLFPSLTEKDWMNEREDGPREEHQGNTPFARILAVQNNLEKSIAFEQDQTALLHLLEMMQWLDQLLAHIQARKLQYQKG